MQESGLTFDFLSHKEYELLSDLLHHYNEFFDLFLKDALIKIINAQGNAESHITGVKKTMFLLHDFFVDKEEFKASDTLSALLAYTHLYYIQLLFDILCTCGTNKDFMRIEIGAINFLLDHRHKARLQSYAESQLLKNANIARALLAFSKEVHNKSTAIFNKMVYKLPRVIKMEHFAEPLARGIISEAAFYKYCTEKEGVDIWNVEAGIDVIHSIDYFIFVKSEVRKESEAFYDFIKIHRTINQNIIQSILSKGFKKPLPGIYSVQVKNITGKHPYRPCNSAIPGMERSLLCKGRVRFGSYAFDKMQRFAPFATPTLALLHIEDSMHVLQNHGN